MIVFEIKGPRSTIRGLVVGTMIGFLLAVVPMFIGLTIAHRRAEKRLEELQRLAASASATAGDPVFVSEFDARIYRTAVVGRFANVNCQSVVSDATDLLKRYPSALRLNLAIARCEDQELWVIGNLLPTDLVDDPQILQIKAYLEHAYEAHRFSACSNYEKCLRANMDELTERDRAFYQIRCVK